MNTLFKNAKAEWSTWGSVKSTEYARRKARNARLLFWGFALFTSVSWLHKYAAVLDAVWFFGLYLRARSYELALQIAELKDGGIR